MMSSPIAIDTAILKMSALSARRFIELQCRSILVIPRKIAASRLALYSMPILFALSLIGSFGVSYIYSIAADLPDSQNAILWNPPESVNVLDKEGNILYTAFNDEDRFMASPDEVPEHVKQAFIAIEDERFFSRKLCIDVEALARAAIANVHEFKSQGASTITQQLARTVYLTREKAFDRKIREIILACKMEMSIPKEDILNLYLNWISFGGTVHGVKQAAKHYFDKDISDISIAEAAVLASMPQRPTYFSPYGPHRYTEIDENALIEMTPSKLSLMDSLPEEALTIGLTGTKTIIHGKPVLLGGRAHQVISAMENQQFITATQRRVAESELYHLSFTSGKHSISAPYYVLHALDEVATMTSSKDRAKQGGLFIHTTIDSTLQAMTEEKVSKHISTVAQKYDAHNVAALLVDRRTSEILAYVGNTDYFGSQTGSKIDMVQSPRQPGSSFKPIVYAYAIATLGWQPYTLVRDVPVTIRGYKPSNYDGRFNGVMTVMNALNYSRNIPAIMAYEAINNEDGLLSFASSLGAKTPKQTKDTWKEQQSNQDFGWPLAIGSAETPLIEMVQAFTTFANAGARRTIHGIKTVDTASGRVLDQSSIETVQAIAPDVANMITSMLSESASRPGGYWRTQTTLRGIDSAVKTGTSNVCVKKQQDKCLDRRPRDIWALGYTPEYVLGIWMGNADGTPLAPAASGLGGPIPLWNEILTTAHGMKENEQVRFADYQAPYYRFHKPSVDPQNIDDKKRIARQ